MIWILFVLHKNLKCIQTSVDKYTNGLYWLIMVMKYFQGLSDIALIVKATSKDSARSTVLWQELQKMNANLFLNQSRLCSSFPLPISPSTDITSIHPNQKTCSYYNSNALPLKITFVSGLPESGSISTIFKVKLQFTYFIYTHTYIMYQVPSTNTNTYILFSTPAFCVICFSDLRCLLLVN